MIGCLRILGLITKVLAVVAELTAIVGAIVLAGLAPSTLQNLNFVQTPAALTNSVLGIELGTSCFLLIIGTFIAGLIYFTGAIMMRLASRAAHIQSQTSYPVMQPFSERPSSAPMAPSIRPGQMLTPQQRVEQQLQERRKRLDRK